MAITEETRHHLFQRLEELLGHEEAVTLMEHLPPVGWADVATRRDLDHVQTVLSGDIERMGLQLRTEMADLRTDLRTDMAGMEVRLLTAFGDFRDQIHAEQRATSRQVILALVVALVSMVLAAVGLP